MVHEKIFDAPGSMREMREAVKQAETTRAFNELPAELYRVYGINNEAIPLVSNRLPGATGSYLTHHLDMLIRTPD